MPTAKPEMPLNPDADRLGRAAGAKPEIIRDGGRFGAGMIKGVSLATVGEALGHGMWLDQTTILQIESYAKAQGEKGLKCRFTHPGMSSDGMGRHLGRLHDIRTVGEQSIGDLHFAQSAHDTPDGDLAEYVMTLTEEDSAAAGLSIVFHHDRDAETEYADQNQEEYEYTDHRDRKRKGYRFKSPDPRNENSYQHVRIAELRAADVVDEPAANPGGMFDAVSLPRDADELLSYAAGISETKPQASAFGVDGDRASQFLGRWLESHGLSLVKKDAEMASELQNDAPENDSVDVTNQPTREEFAAELNKFTTKFGAENGAKWFGENKTFSEAMELHCGVLSEQLSAANERADQAEERLSSLSLGEQDELETGTSDKSNRVTFAEATKRKS